MTRWNENFSCDFWGNSEKVCVRKLRFCKWASIFSMYLSKSRTRTILNCRRQKLSGPTLLANKREKGLLVYNYNVWGYNLWHKRKYRFSVSCKLATWLKVICVDYTNVLHSVSKETQLFFIDFSWGPGQGHVTLDNPRFTGIHSSPKERQLPKCCVSFEKECRSFCFVLSTGKL